MKTKLSIKNAFDSRETHKLRVSTRVLILILALSPMPCALSQVPQGFNYQAVARDGTGNVLQNATMQVRFSIRSDPAAGTLFYRELHPTVTTNNFGVFNLVIGNGTKEYSSLDQVDWSVGPKYLVTEITYNSTVIPMGSAQLYAVPYAMTAKSLTGATKLGITGTTDNLDEALFEVKNKSGHTIFAVYNEGVRIWVDDGAKGLKGGFAVGGFDMTKATKREYFVVSDDSVRIYLDSNPLTKGLKSGFAVGGYDMTKGTVQNYLDVSSDSVRIYIDSDPATKKLKGGFAVGGYDMTKGVVGDYFNVSGKSEAEVITGEPRVLWYPAKEAFRSGNVLIESKDSVGLNSWASGYRSKAIGNYSQALGYQAIARKDYSTAIGYHAVANKINSFAFGQWANAKNEESYAFGRGAIAEGFRSYAFGSAGVDSAGTMTGVAYAKGDYSFAIGQGSQALGKGSFTLGLADTAKGDYSTAFGYKNKASGKFSTAMGLETTASGNFSTAMCWGTSASKESSTAMGFKTIASGVASTAMGNNTTASGEGSIAMGLLTQAYGYYSTAMGLGTNATSISMAAFGKYNDARYYHTDSRYFWYSDDQLFSIGNGSSDNARSNAVTVLKNGNVGIGSLAPTAKLEVNLANSSGWSGNIKALRVFTPDNAYYLDLNTSIISAGNAGYHFNPNGNTGLTISTFGNVGIGTTNPTQKLHVNGDIRLEGGGIQNLSGGVGVGFTNTGWYSDVGNLAARIPNGTTGDLYVQTPSGASTYLRVGPGIGGMELFVGKAVFDNAVGIATSSVGTYKLYVNGNAYSTGTWGGSDIRWKEKILPLENLLSGIQNLKPVSFEWRRDEYPGINFDDGKQIGLIAQEVERIFPELVRTDDSGYKAVSYEKLSVVLLEGMKEQQQQIEAQQKQIDELSDIIIEMRSEIASSR